MKSNNISIISNIDRSLNLTQSEFDINKIVKEGNYNKVDSLSIQQINKITTYMKKSICRIDCNKWKGTGFLCQINISNSTSIKALITCNHVLNRNLINKGDKIDISFNNEKLKFRITINDSTYVYTNKEYDITIIEVFGFEYIKYFLCFWCKNYFLFLKINAENPEDINKDKDIVIFHYEGGKEVKYSNGKLKNIDFQYFYHCCSTKEGSSGSPILMLEDYTVIGIHNGDYQKKTNVGIYIKKPIDAFIEKYNDDLKLGLLKNKKERNIERICSKRDILLLLLLFIIIILLAAIVFLIVFFVTKSKDEDKPGIEYIDENNSIAILYKKQVDKFGSITIFGDDFAESNAFSCKIYYNGKKYSLRNTFSINDMNKNDTILKIQLTEINNIISIKGMFKGCNALISLPDISKIKTENITDISEIFHGCNSLSDLPPSLNWNTEKVVNMSYIFYECASLTSLPDISNWKTNNVKDFRGMFFGCKLLKKLPDISKWSTSKINNIARMFSSCSSIVSLPDILIGIHLKWLI